MVEIKKYIYSEHAVVSFQRATSMERIAWFAQSKKVKEIKNILNFNEDTENKTYFKITMEY